MKIYWEDRFVDIVEFEGRFPQYRALLSVNEFQDFTLKLNHKILELWCDRWPNFKGLSFNLHSQWQYHQKYFQKNSIYLEPLARAIGLRKAKEKIKDKPRVLDCTAGSGSDSILLACFGAQVVAYESHPVIYILLDNALSQLQAPIELIRADFKTADLSQYQVFYFDPMYQQDAGKRQPKKEMRIFREIVLSQPEQTERDFEFLVNHLTSGKRLVVKRPLKAQSLGKPHHSIKGRSTRYDVYLS